MRKKNLIILTSITGLLLTLTPSQALAQEVEDKPKMADSTRDFGPPNIGKILEEGKENDKNSDNERRLASEDKCHWDNEVPVPENGFVKAIYDAAKELDADTYKSGIHPRLQKRVDNGELSEKEARYRSELLKEKEFKLGFSLLLSEALSKPSSLQFHLTKNIYRDNPEKGQELYDNAMKEYSFKALLDYIKEYQNIDYHANYASNEAYDKYKKEFEELEKEKKRLEDNFTITGDSYSNKDIKVNGPLDGYDSEEAQLQAYKDINTKIYDYDRWLNYFPNKEFLKDKENRRLLRHPALFTLSSWFYYMNDDINSLKENDLDNDEFYEKVDKIVKENKDDSDFYLGEIPLLVDKNISFEVDPETQKASSREREIFKSFIIHTDLIIPDNVTCDEEEKPGEDTDTPTNPDTPGDKDTTTPTTKTTSKKDKPSTKTSTKSSDKPTMSTTTNKEENFDTTTPITSTTPTTPNQVKTPGKVNTPNNPINPGQSFTPVKNTNPGTFNGGVSSSVEGEEISDGSKVDTGSPTTSILNKIRTIF